MNLDNIKKQDGCTLLVVSAADLKEFADKLIRQTRSIVEEEYKTQFYSVAELARILHVTQTTIYNYIKENKLPATKIGHRTLFPRIKVQEAIQNGTIGKYLRTF